MRTINLIPQAGKRASETRNRLVLWLALGVLYLVLLGAVTVWRQGAVNDAETELAAQLELNQQLQLEVNSLAGAEQVRNEFESGSALLASVLINDVSWGRLVNDLGRLIPDRVWITNYTATTNPVGIAGGLASIGEVTFSGTAFAPTDVAAWIRVLDSDRYPGVVGTWATGLTANQVAGEDVVTFGSTTTLTSEALSGRLFERIPVIP